MFDHIQPAQDTRERFARLRLARTPRVGPVNFAHLMQRFGSATRALDELPGLMRRNGGSLTPPDPARVEAEIARGFWRGPRSPQPFCSPKSASTKNRGKS